MPDGSRRAGPSVAKDQSRLPNTGTPAALLPLGDQAMEAEMGVLMLVCPITGGEFSTGIHIDIETFRNLPDTRMNSACPRCGTVHLWSIREARLADGPRGPDRILTP
jgi:hypothetical protein